MITLLTTVLMIREYFIVKLSWSKANVLKLSPRDQNLTVCNVYQNYSPHDQSFI